MPRGFLDLGVAGTAKAIASADLSVSEAAELCIAQYEAFESTVKAWTSFDADLLRRRAADLDAKKLKGSALFGVPVGVKDIFNTRDFPTEMGSEIWKGFTPHNDARAVFHLLRAGAIIPGKTTTAEFAVHALSATLNPYDAARTPGTSSSGSAAAVAVGMVPAALGTQTAGSIIRPASFCGVYGYKPSFGLIPRTAMLKTTDSLDTIGFFVSHARDLGVMLDTLRVHGTDYPIVDRKFCDSDGRLAPHKGPWRVAVIKGPAWRHAETYAQEALFGFAKKFEACPRIELVEPELPDGLNRVHDLHSTIYNASLAYYFKDESEQQHLVSPIMNELIERGRRIGLDEYRAALTEQEELIHQMDQRFEDFDCMVTLSTASVAPLREDVELPDSALVWTFLHLPAVSAPVFTSAEGLPFGLQIIGSRYGDVNLLALIDHLAEQGLLPERSNEPRQLVHAAGAA